MKLKTERLIHTSVVIFMLACTLIGTAGAIAISEGYWHVP
jgi:uncharacterized membrane protein YkvI